MKRRVRHSSYVVIYVSPLLSKFLPIGLAAVPLVVIIIPYIVVLGAVEVFSSNSTFYLSLKYHEKALQATCSPTYKDDASRRQC
jgi:hypothetical protein